LYPIEGKSWQPHQFSVLPDLQSPSCRICNPAAVSISILNAKRIRITNSVFKVAGLQIRQDGKTGYKSGRTGNLFWNIASIN